MKILTAHQPVYLPWLGLFHKIALADEFCFFDDVQYLPKDWNNRNKIKTHQGPQWLTVPVLTKGHRQKPIRLIEINNHIDWRRKHLLTLYSAYHSAAYFKTYWNFFEDMYAREWTHLSKLNEYQLKYFLKVLGIKVEYAKASAIKFEGCKSGLVFNMCQKLSANMYIFGALGKDYADVSSFQEAGIKVYFQDYHHPIYPQLFGQFVPYMSVVDLLFNCGSKSRDIIMSGNVIKEEL